MSRLFVKVCAIALAFLAFTGVGSSFDPPLGSETLPWFSSPIAAAGGSLTVPESAPSTVFLNPAANGFEQRTTLELAYGGLVGLEAINGWGSVVVLGLSIPQAYGVWSASAQLISVPDSFQYADAYPLGTAFTLKAAFAKELGGGLSFGIGIGGTVGSNAASDWGLAADLGIVKREGSLGFMTDFSWGIALLNLGKGFAPGAPGGLDAYPSPFTLSIGAAGNVVDTGDFKIKLSADLAFPTFQNVVFGAGLSMSYGGFIGLDAGWRINLAEALSGTSLSYLPSFGFWGVIPLSLETAEGGLLGNDSWKRSDLIPSTSATPLYGGIWGIMLGAKLPLGAIDRNGPKIETSYSNEAPAYVSPNNDGKADELSLPISIDDERYVASWAFELFDASGNPVRTIQNKETRPEMFGSGSIFDSFLYVKKGVAIPESIAWNGTDDSGATVPDGTYAFYVRSADDNGNESRIGPFDLFVDATPPASSLQAADPSMTFSPDGDGAKETFPIKATGSVEDRWTISVADSAGIVARTVTIDGAALSDWEWDGKADSGDIVPDGVYSVTVAATDRAQNTRVETLPNIIVNTTKPVVELSIDGAAFSPNGDGVKDALTLKSSLSSTAGVKDWKIVALDSKGVEVWSVAKGDKTPVPPTTLVVEGKDPTGAAWKEGGYRLVLSVEYVNGYRTSAESPAIVLDVTPPSAKVSGDRPAFNPVGDSSKSYVTFSQAGSQELSWRGEVRGGDGKAVKTFSFEGEPEARVAWDGTNDEGRLVPDGEYSYRLVAVDKAGNSGASNELKVLVDTEKKAVILSLESRAFSPNGDRVKDEARFIAQVAGNERVESWTIAVRRGDLVVREWKGKGPVPAAQAWDGKDGGGKAAPDGLYVGSISVRYVTGEAGDSVTSELALDTTAPKIDVSASPTLFSPDGDGRKDQALFSQRSVAGDSWEGRVLDEAGRAIRTWTWKDSAADFAWDGKDDAGNVAPDGRYRYVVSSIDAAGNKAEAAVNGLELDTREPRVFLTASRAGFSPNGDKFLDDLKFGIVVPDKAGVESWQLSLATPEGAVRRVWKGSGASTIPAQVDWDGKGDDGLALQGSFVATLAVTYAMGDQPSAQAGPVTLDTEGPKVRVATSPEFFSPDNDGLDDELEFAIGIEDLSAVDKWTLTIYEAAASETGKGKEKSLVSFSGTGRPAERIKWDGRSAKGETVESATDYPFYLTVTDAYGNVTKYEGTLSTDVLVKRDGENLRIMVPSIVFRPGFADFVNLPKDRVDRNMKTIQRIAAILNRFKDYRIVVQGHAINTAKYAGKSQAEINKVEKAETIPISLQRAQAVVRLLVEAGVDPSRLQAVGVGSAAPVVPYTDDENLWKNRRVEFILIKK
jgi:flagellar hook assembly protein FlgD